jgi:hypothetical protein
MVKFSKANAKIEALESVPDLKEFLNGNKEVYSFDLLSGFSCPFANECLSKAIENNGRRTIKDGPNTKFRCFSASQEVQYTNVYNLRKQNFDTLKSIKTIGGMVSEIESNMPANLGICRIHVAGDFWSSKYFAAWINIATRNPGRLFYAYTKSIKYWVEFSKLGLIPSNLVLTASLGGRLDNLAAKYKLRTARVVFSEQQAADLGLEIDHTDEHAANPNTKDKDFALLIHGTMPKGSEAAAAIKELKKNKVKFSYSR